MSRSLLCVFLSLMVAGAAQAQAPENPAPPEQAAGSAETTEEEAAQAPENPAPPERVDAAPEPEKKLIQLESGAVVSVPKDSVITAEPASRLQRQAPLSMRLLGEGVVGMAGMLAGGVLTWAVTSSYLPNAWPAAVLGGATLGSIVGVTWLGDVLGGRGSWVGAAVGSMVGAGLFCYSLMLSFGYSSPPYAGLLLVASFAAPPLLGATGYEFGSLLMHLPSTAARGPLSLRAMVVPMPGGAALALGGRM